jgi:hypothetical protein
MIPQWIHDLLYNELKYDGDVFYHGSDPRISSYYLYNPSVGIREIHLYCPEDRCNESLRHILHEYAHHVIGPCTKPVKKNRKNGRKAIRTRDNWHGKEFRNYVLTLYKKYGILKYTSEFEYMRIRKAACKMLESKE